MAAAADYDAPRRNQTEESGEDPLIALTIQRNDAKSATVDVDEAESDGGGFAGSEMSNLFQDEMVIRVMPKQADEFTCAACFLVHHRSRLGRTTRSGMLCRDCA